MSTLLLLFGRAAAPPGPAAKTLEKAIALRFRENPASAFVDGGIRYGTAPDNLVRDDPARYIVFVENGGLGRMFTTARPGALTSEGKPAGSPSKSVEYRFFCHGPTDMDGRTMRDLIEDTFGPRSAPLEWERGVTTQMVPRDEGVDPNDYTDGRARKIRLAYIDIRFTFDRYPLTP
jgi:hypothetical protein